MQMVPALLIVTDTGASVSGVIATGFSTLNRGVLVLLSCRSSASVSASKLFGNTASRYDFGTNFEVIANGRDWMGKLRHSMGNTPLTNLSPAGQEALVCL